jgi:hypothetical protein
MKTTPIQYWSASKGKFSEPPPKPNFSSGCELYPGLIAMVRAQPLLGHYNENPYHHLHEFEEMCSCLSISGMAQETLKWKLFSFSLMGKAKQWYTHVIESTNGDWDELKDNFHLAFSLCHVSTLYQWQSLTLSSARRSL